MTATKNQARPTLDDPAAHAEYIEILDEFQRAVGDATRVAVRRLLKIGAVTREDLERWAQRLESA